MPNEYADVELHIGPDGYARVHSFQGEQAAIIPATVPQDLQLALALIERNSTDEGLLQTLGKKLYSMIFPPAIHTHFTSTEAVARNNKEKVRIRLIIEPDALAALPWEFIYREEGGYFLAVNPDTVLSRYLDLPMPPSYVRQRKGPLHLLVIVANPTDQTPLDPDEWEAIIMNALAAPLQQQLITTTVVKHATYRNVTDALLGQSPDMLQFIGHGIYENGKGYLALVDHQTGGTWLVDDTRFANIFLGFTRTLGLVSLATCESAKSDSPRSFLGIAPKIVQHGVPAVVAMQYSVLIRTAEIFLENFYTGIAARRPADWAVQQARNAISILEGLGNREFATPVLYMRAKDGRIFG